MTLIQREKLNNRYDFTPAKEKERGYYYLTEAVKPVGSFVFSKKYVLHILTQQLLPNSHGIVANKKKQSLCLFAKHVQKHKVSSHLSIIILTCVSSLTAKVVHPYLHFYGKVLLRMHTRRA